MGQYQCHKVKVASSMIDGLASTGEVGERGRLPRDGRGDGKACRYQQGHKKIIEPPAPKRSRGYEMEL